MRDPWGPVNYTSKLEKAARSGNLEVLNTLLHECVQTEPVASFPCLLSEPCILSRIRDKPFVDSIFEKISGISYTPSNLLSDVLTLRFAYGHESTRKHTLDVWKSLMDVLVARGCTSFSHPPYSREIRLGEEVCTLVLCRHMKEVSLKVYQTGRTNCSFVTIL